MPDFAPGHEIISRLEKDRVSVDCRGKLDGNETIESVGLTVAEQVTAHLGISEVAVTNAPVQINKQTVPAGQAVQFMCDARGVDVKEQWFYRLHIEFDTSDGRHLAGGIKLKTD